MRQRIAMLDCARGIAILGILLMNITAFGLPKAAYLNPAYAGSITRGEAWTWAVLDYGGAGEISYLVRALVWRRSSVVVTARDCSG